VARTHGHTALVDHIKRYLTNEPQSKDTYPLTWFKLTPTPRGKSVPKSRPEKAYHTYHLFRQWIEDFVRHGPRDFEGALDEPEGAGGQIDEGYCAGRRLSMS